MPARKKSASLSEEAGLYKKFRKIWERAQSEFCEIRGSEIHGRGVYAVKFIPEGARIIEYVGERIGKKTSDRRGTAQQTRAEETGGAAVYIFTLNDEYDLDGDLPWNTARLINHSCAPNCEAQIDRLRIFVYALRDIREGEELTFDYGFDVEHYEDHPCRCGAPGCVGHIVSREQWPELEKRKKAKGKPTD